MLGVYGESRLRLRPAGCRAHLAHSAHYANSVHASRRSKRASAQKELARSVRGSLLAFGNELRRLAQRARHDRAEQQRAGCEVQRRDVAPEAVVGEAGGEWPDRRAEIERGQLPAVDLAVGLHAEVTAGEERHQVDLGRRGEAERQHRDADDPGRRAGQAEQHATDRAERQQCTCDQRCAEAIEQEADRDAAGRARRCPSRPRPRPHPPLDRPRSMSSGTRLMISAAITPDTKKNPIAIFQNAMCRTASAGVAIEFHWQRMGRVRACDTVRLFLEQQCDQRHGHDQDENADGEIARLPAPGNDGLVMNAVSFLLIVPIISSAS